MIVRVWNRSSILILVGVFRREARDGLRHDATPLALPNLRVFYAIGSARRRGITMQNIFMLRVFPFEVLSSPQTFFYPIQLSKFVLSVAVFAITVMPI